MRPTPFSPPSRFRVVTRSGADTGLPSSATGIPSLKPTSMYVGSSGQRRGSRVHAYTSFGGPAHGPPSTPASIARPHRFSSPHSAPPPPPPPPTPLPLPPSH